MGKVLVHATLFSQKVLGHPAICHERDTPLLQQLTLWLSLNSDPSPPFHPEAIAPSHHDRSPSPYHSPKLCVTI
jgi:hypothetical protein